MTSFTGRGADGHVDQLIGAYALDALDDIERTSVERHLAGCGSCSAEVAELAETTALLGAAEEAPPPPALRDRVLAAARATPQLPPLVAGRPGVRGMRRLAAVAAAVVVLAGAVGTTWAYQEHRIGDERARVVAAQQENARIQAVITAPDAHAVTADGVRAGQISAIYSASQGAAVFAYGGLATTPAGKTYQLWRIDGTVPTSLGALAAGVRSGSTYVDHLGPDDALAVSIENDGGAARPHQVIAKLVVG
jgi:hypothetical protein